MRQNAAVLILILTTGVTSCASQSGAVEADDFMRYVTVHATPPEVPLDGALGTPTNPVRTNGPHGERDYFARLRCTDGQPPEFERIGSTGPGPYGTILDGYRVKCRGEEGISVSMDMYHCREETKPINGFDIVERVVPIPPFGDCPAAPAERR